MATEILLTSEAFVKSVSNISDNVAGKYLRPSIREAQEIKMRTIIGDALLDKLKALVEDNTIGEVANAAYKTLVDRAQYFLAYSAIVELVPKVTFKIANAGVVKTPDEKVEVVNFSDLTAARAYYQTLADTECRKIQQYILRNRADYPELDDCEANEIHATLRSAASCGIFLGGARGKIIR